MGQADPITIVRISGVLLFFKCSSVIRLRYLDLIIFIWKQATPKSDRDRPNNW